MCSKKLMPFLLSLLIVGCAPGTIPDQQASTPENHDYRQEFGERSTNEIPIAGSARYTENHSRIQKMIEDGSEVSLLKAGKELMMEILGENAIDEMVYSDPAYGAYLELFVFFVRESNRSMNKLVLTVKNNMVESFYKEIMEPCLLQSPGVCQMARNAFGKTNKLGDVALEIARRTEDLSLKLRILGLVFDFQGKRKSAPLNDYYIDIVLNLVSESSSKSEELLSKKERIRHIRNIEILGTQMDWESPSPRNVSRVQSVKPWLKGVEKNSGLNSFRKSLVPYLSLYISKSKEIAEEVQSFVASRVDGLKEAGFDLKNYPAYNDISLSDLSEEDIEALYLVLELYSSGITVSEANQYMLHLSPSRKAIVIDSALRISKTLIRWDIAQLGIESTKKLADRFSEQDVKTPAFLQDTLDWSKSLIPLWADFHNIRVPAMKFFIEGNMKYSSRTELSKALEFFSAINRNILKTVVYPNMIAFTYEMAKTEYELELRILWFTFTIKASLILEYMINGQYSYPWFNFVNLQQGQSGDAAGRNTSLYRSEIYDSIHYFFSTRTFQEYDIKADAFFSEIAETLVSRRRGRYEETFNLQKQIYMPENSPSNRLLGWCEGISKKSPKNEVLSFYNLKEYLAPAIPMLDNPRSNSVIAQSWNNNFLSMYFYDDYRNIMGIGNDNIATTNDRYRLIFSPLFHILERYLKIGKRLQKNSPELKMGSLQNYENKLNEIKLLKLNYFGMQKQLGDRYQDCLMVAQNESKRRLQKVVLGLDKYFKHIVYPAMKALKNKEISLEDANSILNGGYTYPQGMQDYFLVSTSGQVEVVLSKLTYFMRVRQLLVEGIDYEVPLPSGVASVKVEPVVGSHLKIPVAENFLTDRNGNPFLSRNYTLIKDYRKFVMMDSPEEFSQSVLASIVNAGRSNIESENWDDWDRYGIKPIVEMLESQLEYEVTMVQIPEAQYVAVFEPGCLVSSWDELPKECIKTHKPEFDRVVKVVEDILSSYILNEQDKRFFELISGRGWIGHEALNTVLKHDTTYIYSNDTSADISILPYRKLAGVFDLVASKLRSDYLGYSFYTDFEAFRAAQNINPHGGSIACEFQRESCYFKNERVVAEELFFARELKSKLMFNFDKEILTEEFAYNQQRIVGKLQRLVDLKAGSQSLVDSMIERHPGFDEEVLIDLSRPKLPLKPLGQRYQNPEFDFDEYLRKKTQGFYLEEHNWDDYMIQ